jgi:hypothetical protein
MTRRMAQIKNEQPTTNEIVSHRQSKATFSRELITPEIAEAMLTKNHNNRSCSRATVDLYVRAMLEGQWGECPQPIVLSGDNLLDGQHRLAAIVKSETSQWFWVCRNAEESVQRHIDRGRPRRVQDVLLMVHGMKQSNAIVAICRRLSILDGDRASLHKRIGEWEVLDIFKRYEEPIRRMLETTPTAWRAAYFLAPLIWVADVVPRIHLDGFRDAVVTGANLAEGSPALKLRDFLLRHRTHHTGVFVNTTMLRVLTCLHHHVRGESLGNLYVSLPGFQHYRELKKLPVERDDWARKVRERYYKQKRRVEDDDDVEE